MALLEHLLAHRFLFGCHLPVYTHVVTQTVMVPSSCFVPCLTSRLTHVSAHQSVLVSPKGSACMSKGIAVTGGRLKPKPPSSAPLCCWSFTSTVSALILLSSIFLLTVHSVWSCFWKKKESKTEGDKGYTDNRDEGFNKHGSCWLLKDRDGVHLGESFTLVLCLYNLCLRINTSHRWSNWTSQDDATNTEQDTISPPTSQVPAECTESLREWIHPIWSAHYFHLL